MKNLINEEVQSSKKVKSSKFLKTCFVGCLATCLTLTGIFTFAPLGATAEANSNNQSSSLNNNLNNSTIQTSESAGLITPRADDPVLFTTENGLEIKYGNAINIQPSLPYVQYQVLSGYPYFSTINGSTTYDWVIIGMGAAPDATPAGQAILDDANKNYRKLGSCISGRAQTSEIPPGCVLVLSNVSVVKGAYGARDCGIYADSTIKRIMDGYYTNGSFGLSSVKNNIQQIKLLTTNYITNKFQSEDLAYIYPLAGVPGDTFYPSNYFSSLQMGLANAGNASNFWFRGTTYVKGDAAFGRFFSNINYSIGDSYADIDTYGYRPAFVINLV